MFGKLHRLFTRRGRQPEAGPAAPAESEDDYQRRLLGEQSQFDDCPNVHELPDIFHYWSNKYLVPMFEPFGFRSPNEFFLTYIRNKCLESPDQVVTVASIGAGNCDLEVELGTRLMHEGQENFRFDCIELNRHMLDRASGELESASLASRFRLLEQDFNLWRPDAGQYHVIMANQSLHHVLELEHLFGSIRTGLAPGGVFLTSDMIGRNGHQRWPEALEMVNDFWPELPLGYRYNQSMQRMEEQYINHDCSTSGFEGIRAQDVLPLLIERFNFELFIPYANIVFVFIDRPFGHNFDAAADWDRDFIDRVHAADEQAIQSGHITPTSMLAAMRLEPTETKLRHDRLTPRFCVRQPGAN